MTIWRNLMRFFSLYFDSFLLPCFNHSFFLISYSFYNCLLLNIIAATTKQIIVYTKKIVIPISIVGVNHLLLVKFRNSTSSYLSSSFVGKSSTKMCDIRLDAWFKEYIGSNVGYNNITKLSMIILAINKIMMAETIVMFTFGIKELKNVTKLPTARTYNIAIPKL